MLKPRSEVQVVTVRSNRIVRSEQLVRTLSLSLDTISHQAASHLALETLSRHEQSFQPHEKTAPIPWNATSSQVKDALLALDGTHKSEC